MTQHIYYVKNPVVVVRKEEAEKIKNLLLEKGLLDDERRIKRHEDNVEIPVKIEGIKRLKKFKIKEQKSPIYRRYYPPFDVIKNEAKKILKKDEIRLLPKKWEKIGDILILKFPEELEARKEILEIYAKVLNCRAILGDKGIIGEKREPLLVHLYGDKNTETVHVENKIKFKLDASKIMFSSGNVDERIRMAYIANEGERVVDMFAGIGYFSIPMAVYSKVNVYAIEINPTAYFYLKENIMLNGVEERVKAILGDCREMTPKNFANRVIMGYLHSKNFLPIAINALRKEGGIIHYHFLCTDKNFPSLPIAEVKKIAKENGKDAFVISSKQIKSYAPRILHGVLDVKIK